MVRLISCLRPDVLWMPTPYRGGLFSLFFYALAILLIPSQGAAEEGAVAVFSSGTAPVYNQVARRLQSYLNEECGEIGPTCSPRQVHILTESHDGLKPVIPPDTKLIITLGQRAGNMTEEWDTGIPVLHALVPQTAYQQMAKDSPHSAIFLDQPISRLLRLASIINSDPHIGLLLSPLTTTLQDGIVAEGMQQSIPISYRNVDSTAVVGHSLKEVLEESNILLALPDPNIFNSATIFNILLSSYHKKIPVIGFSSAYVKAGALVAAYSTPDDIARHLAEYTNSYLDSGAGVLPGPIYPKYFSVSVNQSVARSLGISLPDEAVIIRQMLGKSKQ